MGGCASSKHQERHPSSLPPKQHNRSQQFRPEVVRVICEDGRVEEFSPPLTEAMAVAGSPYYLCSWESMYVDACPPEVAPEEGLKPGQLYFAMPKSKANQPMSLHQMCALAIKASSALSLQDFHSSFRR